VVVFAAGGNVSQKRDVGAPPAQATTKTPCEVGERPEYFVPIGPEGSSPVIIGCARLGQSRKPVEFSANSEPIEREDWICLNPAYHGGVYIPAVCMPDPVSRGFEVASVGVPRQAGRGYQFVVWGTAAPATRQVVAHHEGGQSKAAVFTVRGRLARAARAMRPFSVFVVELHRKALCHRVLVRATGASSPSRIWLRRRHLRPGVCPEGPQGASTP
jgi:hypothetical protein